MQFIIFVAESILAGFLLWLGLYILVHEQPLQKGKFAVTYSPAAAAGLSMILVSWFMFGVAMQTVSATVLDYILC